MPHDQLQLPGQAPTRIGANFGSWTVIGLPEQASGRSLWLSKLTCRCVCGRVREVYIQNLLRGLSSKCKSCTGKQNTFKHGASATASKKEDRLYRIYRLMKARCSPSPTGRRKPYHERGIRVCREWAESYVAFRDWSLANGYRDNLTIDRWPDKRGNYEPSNCRWAGYKPQANNKTDNRLLTAFGETKTTAEWADDPRCSVKSSGLRCRLARGWPVEEAITLPKRTYLFPTPEEDWKAQLAEARRIRWQKHRARAAAAGD